MWNKIKYQLLVKWCGNKTHIYTHTQVEHKRETPGDIINKPYILFQRTSVTISLHIYIYYRKYLESQWEREREFPYSFFYFLANPIREQAPFPGLYIKFISKRKGKKTLIHFRDPIHLALFSLKMNSPLTSKSSQDTERWFKIY